MKGKILESKASQKFNFAEKIHKNSKSFDLRKKQIRQSNKFLSKKKGTQGTAIIADKKKWIINICLRQLTKIKTDNLTKYLNFSITSKALPNKDIIISTENWIEYLEKEEADTTFAKMSLPNFKLHKDTLWKNEYRLKKNYKLINEF